MGEDAEKAVAPAPECVEPAPPVVAAAPDSAEPAPPVTSEVSETVSLEKAVAEAELGGEAEEENLAAAVEAIEEKTVEAEEKTVETVEGKDGEAVVDRESAPPTAEEPAVPFKEESYYVKDLKESEKKALLDLKAKIEEAIKANIFLVPPKPETTREVEVEKKETETGVKEGEVEVKTEETTVKEEAVEETEPIITETPAPAASIEAAPTEAAPPCEVEAAKEEAPPPPPPPPVEEAPAAPAVEEEVVKEEVPAAEPTKEEAAPTKEEEAAPSEPVAEATPAPVEETIGEPSGEEVEVEKSTRDVVIEEDKEEPPLEDLALWGVPLLHTKGDERTDVVLLKFLRARDFKVNDAFSMLKETVVWRKTFNADSLIDEEVGTEFDSVAYMHGCDREGHPVCYNHFGVFQDKELYHKTFGDEAQLKNFVRWRIQVLEKGIQKLNFSAGGVHSMVQITDLKDSPGIVKQRNITKKILTLLQDNYPELVAKQIFINVPWYFGVLYALHERIVTPRSKSKVVVARQGKVTETLFKYISPENVPLKYGGLSRPNDGEFEGVEAPVKQVTVKAGEKQTIELPVVEPGSTVVWDIAVVGWEVVYGEEFVPTTEGSYTVIIQKSKKMSSSEEPIRNSFKATEPGKIVLTIDNGASRRKRIAVYRYIVKEPTTPPPPPDC